MNTKRVAALLGISEARVRQLAREVPAEFAWKDGRGWQFNLNAVSWLRLRLRHEEEKNEDILY